MQNTHLPEDLRGQWIWSRGCLAALECYVCFRKEFALSETPARAELWITARTFFHLYINGRHVSFGPAPSPTDEPYVMCYDISYLLETGKNVVAVLTHNTQVARYARRRQPGGLWCQLHVDDRLCLYSDDSWQCQVADWYAGNRPRRSSASGFTEKINFATYPNRWTERDFAPDQLWNTVDFAMPVGPYSGNLGSVLQSELLSYEHEFSEMVLLGHYNCACATTHVSLRVAVAEHGEGVYAAETYVHVDEPQTLQAEIYCDDPYVLLVNGVQSKNQAVPALPAGTAVFNAAALCYGQSEQSDPSFKLELQSGWNRVVLVMQAGFSSNGAVLIFPERTPQAFAFVRGSTPEEMAGWNLYGPLRTPLAKVRGCIEFGNSRVEAYTPLADFPINEGAYLMSCGFEGEPGGSVPDSLQLERGRYVILSLASTGYGCPQLRISGSAGDVIYVVSGELLAGDQIVPINDGRQQVDVLVLGQHPVQWTAVAPRGLRYLMLVAVAARETILIEDPRVLVRETQHNHDGSFECSEPLLNEIWQTGRRTLQVTMQDFFLDGPCKDTAQYVADAMIQSWAAYHVFGDYHLADKGLLEFAKAQYETGEMAALHASDIYLNMPDYSLLWPVWLQRHYLYSGNRELLEQLQQPLQRLLSYYESIAGDEGVLFDLDQRFDAFCFLDHGNVDRRGMVTGLNAIYCRSLLSGAWIMEQLGYDDRARTLRRRVGRIADAVRYLAWDEQRGLFADGFSDGQMSQYYSWQTNVLAIYGGLARRDDYASIFSQVFAETAPFEPLAVGETNNPYFQYFVLETAFALGRRSWAFDLIRWYWGGMLKRGAKTWWEMFDPDGRVDELPMISYCHGYGVSPNAYLCSELVGIRPIEPGMTTVVFNPLLGIVDSARMRLPTPHGRICVEWNMTANGEFEASIESNYPLNVVPQLDPAVAESAVIRVNDEVSILT